MARQQVGVDTDFQGNTLFNKGEESIALSAVITPTILGANVNDYNPTSIQIASILRLSSSGAIQITGIVAPDAPVANPTRWKFLYIVNISANNITLVDASASSLANNRFAMNGNTILNGNEGAIFFYDQTSLRWRCLGRAI